MPARRLLPVAVTFVCVLVMGVVGPAVGAGAVERTTEPGPTCQIADPETIVGAMFVNGQFVNGTWDYATGVGCSSNVADIALFEQLDLNGTKVNSAIKGFTGVARKADAILSQFPCTSCDGTWEFIWGQVVEAPTGTSFVSAPSGCVLEQSGHYLVCVQTKTVTL